MDLDQARDMDANSPAQVPAADPAAPSPPTNIPPKPAYIPNAGTVDVIGNLPPAENAMQKTAEHMAFADDLNAGRIHPKTYQDLFDSESTIGKMGTLFGLLVSGAGSGLAHQPNAVLDMMNKNIERDLESQKANQSNKLNWYNAAMAHEKAIADNELTNARTAAENAGTWGATEDAALKHWQNSQLPGILNDSATTSAKNHMVLSYLQIQQEQINKMPPGATKAAAQNQFDTVLKPAALQTITQNNQAYASRKGLRDVLAPNPLKGKDKPVDVNESPLDDAKFNQMALLGNMGNVIPEKSLTPGEQQAVLQERGKIKQGRVNYGHYAQNFDELAKLHHAGQVPGGSIAGGALKGVGTGVGGLFGGPMGAIAGSALGSGVSHGADEIKNIFEQKRNAYTTPIKELLRNSGQSDASAQDLIDSMFPSWTDEDDDETRKIKFDQGTQLFKNNEPKMAPISDQKKLLKPFPVIQYKPSTDQKKKNKEKSGRISDEDMTNTKLHSR